MKVTVDEDKCIGCGVCTAIAPKSFKMKAGKAEAIEPPGDDEKAVKEGAESCPVEAIKIS